MSSAITLNPGTLKVTLTGSIDAIAAVGTYSILIGKTVSSETLSAAVFGPKTGHFTVTNTGTIKSDGTDLDFGILLGTAGTVINSGHITAGNGIGLFGTATGALAENTGTIDATAGSGLYLQGLGTATNTGIIDAEDAGILLGAGGFASNASTGAIISTGLDGIEARAAATIQNAGTISGEDSGIHLNLAGTVKNTGTITERDTQAKAAAYAAIYAGDGASITNSGHITGGNGIKILHPGTTAASIYIANTGTITASSTVGLTSTVATTFLKYGAGIYSTDRGRIVNGGLIAGNHAGIVFESAIGTVSNTGHITSSAGEGVFLGAGGTLTNSGTIYGFEQGVVAAAGAATNIITNSGLIEAPKTAVTTANGIYFSAAIIEAGAGTVSNSGTISGGTGIAMDGASYSTSGVKLLAASIINSGLITGTYGIDFAGLGGIDNTGTIKAVDIGVDVYTTVKQVLNTGLIEATGGLFVYAGVTQTPAGIVLRAAGTITNTSTGTISAASGNGLSVQYGGLVLNEGVISGYRQGIDAGYGAAATIINSGTVIATGVTFPSGQGIPEYCHGVELKDGGRLTNTSTGTIIGQVGIEALATAIIDNAGHVTAVSHAGIVLAKSGTVSNAKTGTITADGTAGTGIALNAGGAAYNYGVIKSTGYGIYLGKTGAVYNGGGITAATAGIYAGSAASVYNYAAGIIHAATGIYLATGGVIDNAGLISASGTGIILAAGGTVTDSGTITGKGGAIAFNAADSASNLLILSAAAVTTGTVNGGDGRLELIADGTKAGTLAFSQFADFDSVTIGAKAIWDIAGKVTTGAGLTLVNDGTIRESATDLITIAGGLTGTGTVDLSKKRFALDGTVAAGQTIAFSGTGETLALGDVSAFSAKLDSFATGDTIDLTGVPRSAITGDKFAAGILTLSESKGSLTLTFASPATFANETFTLFKDGAGTGITLASTAAIPAAAPPQGWLTANLLTPSSDFLKTPFTLQP